MFVPRASKSAACPGEQPQRDPCRSRRPLSPTEAPFRCLPSPLPERRTAFPCVVLPLFVAPSVVDGAAVAPPPPSPFPCVESATFALLRGPCASQKPPSVPRFALPRFCFQRLILECGVHTQRCLLCPHLPRSALSSRSPCPSHETRPVPFLSSRLRPSLIFKTALSFFTLLPNGGRFSVTRERRRKLHTFHA